MRFALALTLCMLSAVPCAQAAEVALNDSGELYVAGDPQDNQLSVAMAGANVYEVRDQLVPLSVAASSSLRCNYPDPDNEHVVHCTKPARQGALISYITGGDGNDVITVSGPIPTDRGAGLYGQGGDDELNGGASFDQVIGGPGNDVVNGGQGADNLYGGEGNDTLFARDGTKDLVVECDNSGDDIGPSDIAVVDSADPDHNCNQVDRADGATGPEGDTDSDGRPDSSDNCPQTANGDQADADADGKGDACDFEDPIVKVTVPDARPKGKGARTRYRHMDALRKELRELDVPVRLVARGVALGGVRPKALAETIEDGEIFRQGGEPGEEVTIDPTCAEGTPYDCVLTVEVGYYDQAKDLAGNRCPYTDRRGTERDETRDFLRLLRARTYSQAVRVLRAERCRFRVVNYVETKAGEDERIRSANVARDGARPGRPYWVDLVVSRPARAELTLSIGPRPYADWKDNPGRVNDFDRELDLGADGKLSFAKRNQGVLHVIVNENFTGRFVQDVVVELVKNPTGQPQEARVVDSARTDRAGAVTFTIPLDWTGQLEVNARVRAKRDSDDLVEDTVQGWVTIPVVERARTKVLRTQSGRSFRFQRKRWRPVETFGSSMGAFAQALRDLNKWPDPVGAACRAAVGDARSQRAVRNCWQSGIAVVRSSNGGATTGAALPGGTEAPGFVVRGGGLAQSKIPSAIIPSTGSTLGAAVLAKGASTMVFAGDPIVNWSAGAIMNGGGPSLAADAGNGSFTNIRGTTVITGILSQTGASIISSDLSSLLDAEPPKIPDAAVGLHPIAR